MYLLLFIVKLRITTVLACLCIHILSIHPSGPQSISESRSGLIVVFPSQKIKLYPDDPTHCHLYIITTDCMTLTMSHHLTEEYWESLGPSGPFLCELFHNQSQQLAQLQTANNVLKGHALEAQ